MNRDKLVKRQEDLKARFDVIQRQRDSLTDELLRLQGEHRLITDLIDKFDKFEEPTKIKVKNPTKAEQ